MYQTSRPPAATSSCRAMSAPDQTQNSTSLGMYHGIPVIKAPRSSLILQRRWALRVTGPSPGGVQPRQRLLYQFAPQSSKRNAADSYRSHPPDPFHTLLPGIKIDHGTSYPSSRPSAAPRPPKAIGAKDQIPTLQRGTASPEAPVSVCSSKQSEERHRRKPRQSISAAAKRCEGPKPLAESI